MLLGIDHLVIAVPDPDAAAEDFEAALGLAATGGGRHEQAGTFNRLIFLGDTYLELIGVWDRDLAAGHPIGAAALATLEAGAPGLVTWAVATDGARRQVGALRAAGSAIGDAVPGERVRQDGAVVRWHVATAATLAADRPPFLIEHELAGPEWGDEARRARAAFVHPCGGQARLAGLELVVSHPAEVAFEFARTVGLAFGPAPGAAPGDQESRLGDHVIRLVASNLSGDPAARVGIRVTALGRVSADDPATVGPRQLVDLCGVRFARL